MFNEVSDIVKSIIDTDINNNVLDVAINIIFQYTKMYLGDVENADIKYILAEFAVKKYNELLYCDNIKQCSIGEFSFTIDTENDDLQNNLKDALKYFKKIRW